MLCNIVQYCKILPSITQYRSSGYFNALSSFDIVWIYIYCQILSSISRYCQALHNIVKHYAILSGIDQYCSLVLHVVKTYKTAQSSWNWKKVFNIVRNSWIFWKQSVLWTRKVFTARRVANIKTMWLLNALSVVVLVGITTTPANQRIFGCQRGWWWSAKPKTNKSGTSVLPNQVSIFYNILVIG